MRDATTLAAAIARLQDDPALCERLGKAAREKALAQFDERIVLDRTLAVYRGTGLMGVVPAAGGAAGRWLPAPEGAFGQRD